MLDPQLYVLFLTAALLLIVTPGPDTLFVLAASIGGGTRDGLLATAGILTGLLVHIGFAVVGVSMLIATSPLAFEAIRWTGAAYLVWIGAGLIVRAWHGGRETPAASKGPRPTRVYWQGAMTNVLNPKVAVFYVAFLPQFVSAELGHVPLQLLLLGVTHWLMGIPYLAAVAMASGTVSDRLHRSWRMRRVLDGIAGAVFVGLALRLLLSKRS
jgi:threonine/homoserine/homoserine lactone efflux protein